MQKRKPVRIGNRYHQAKYFEDSGMPLCVFKVDERPDILLHDHDFTELVVVVGGSGLHLAESKSYPIRAGDVFVIHKQTLHAYRNGLNLQYINVLFDLKQLGLQVKDIAALEGYQALFVLEPRQRSAGGAHHHCRLSEAELTVARELLANLMNELARKTTGYKAMATVLFLQVIGFLSRCYSRIPDPEPRSLIRLGRVLGYIESHFAEPVKLELLAREASMSPSSLQQMFRRSFQTSPIDYLIALRIRKSLALLTGGELNITEIAFRVGFSDSNYFTRQFRRRMGLTPREFQRKAIGAKRPAAPGGDEAKRK